MIEVTNLTRIYTTYKRAPTMAASFKSIFRREKIQITAVKAVSFKIEEGSLTALIGPNGAGKSTLIKMLTGVLYPTSGEAEVMGCVPWRDRKKYVRNIGAVFGQKSQLIWDIPPADAFNLHRTIYQIPQDRYKKNISRLCEMLGMGDEVNRPTRQLSLGQRMKCEFIITMLHDPQIVFLDEPTIGLDVIAKESIRQFISEINKNGTTIILTTHDLSDVEELARKILVLNHGEIVFWDDFNKLNKSLSPRKLVKFRTSRPMDLDMTDGIRILETPLPNEIELELSLDKIPLFDFVQRLADTGGITDLEIKEIPIESVIKQLYKKA